MPEKILSICIPTYNRADILDKTLSKLVLEPSFQSGKIEVCISDNASPDNTEMVIKKYADKYNNIIYSRNKENTVIIDDNFPIVGSLASGTFIKFLNDTAFFITGELDKIIDLIEANKRLKPLLFFSNNNLLDKINEIIHCYSLESFVQIASYWPTWVGGAGIWRSDFVTLIDRDRSAEKFMWCPDIYLRLLSSGRKAIIYNKPFCSITLVSSKGGYNIYQVFVTNYLGLLERYKAEKQISRITLFNEKNKLLIHFLIPWTLTLWTEKTKYKFHQEGALNIVFKKYCFNPLFYVGIIYLFLKLIFLKLHTKYSQIHKSIPTG